MDKTVSFNGLSIEEISEFLIQKGYTVGSNKPSEYISRGLVLSGMRNIDNGGTRAYKGYYSPVVPVEFMTASLLKKGNWLELDPKQTHTKLTDRDVFYGRLAFYREICCNRNDYNSIFEIIDKTTGLLLCHFFTEVTYWFQEQSANPNEVPIESVYMEQGSIDNVLRKGKAELHACFHERHAVEAYIEWAKWQYGLTFIYVLNKYKEEILSLPLTSATAKVEEQLYEKAVKTRRRQKGLKEIINNSEEKPSSN